MLRRNCLWSPALPRHVGGADHPGLQIFFLTRRFCWIIEGEEAALSHALIEIYGESDLKIDLFG
jgi:hypothetical protein